MSAWRCVAGLLGALALARPVASWAGDPAEAPAAYTLAEKPAVGECFRVGIDMTLTGELRVVVEGKPAPLRLSATARHAYHERLLADQKAARYYETATMTDSNSTRELRPDRRLMVARRADDALTCFSPAGPLTRDELELVAEHFDSLAVTGLLPGKEVAAGGTWKIENATAQAACQFEALVKHDLTGKLIEVKDGAAWFEVAGTAEGIDLGAPVTMTVTAKGKFDLLTKRLVRVEWKQKEKRGNGPASPESESVVAVTLTREPAEKPKELADVALVGVPGGETPAELLLLTHPEAKGRFTLTHGREWHRTGGEGNQTIFRLLDRGEFVAQATFTVWDSAEPGKHISPTEFEQTMANTPGWEVEEVLEKSEAPADGGKWVYRVPARGNMDGVPVVQNFFVVAAPSGAQVVVAFTMKPGSVPKIGSRDIGLVGGIEFPKK
jgi:hypothetical protein